MTDDSEATRAWTIEVEPSECETMPCLCCDLNIDLEWRKGTRGLLACHNEPPMNEARKWPSYTEWRSNIIEERRDAVCVRCPRCHAEFFLTLDSCLFKTTEKSDQGSAQTKGRRKKKFGSLGITGNSTTSCDLKTRRA